MGSGSVYEWWSCGPQKGFCIQSKSELLSPHPGSHTVRGFTQAPVSSRKCSSEVMHFRWLKSCERCQGWPFAVRCVQHVVVYKGHTASTCFTVWTGSPQGHATCSCVCWGWNHCMYAPMNACPVIIWYIVLNVNWENLAVSCLARNVGCILLSGGLVSVVLYASEVHGDWCHHSAHVLIVVVLVAPL